MFMILIICLQLLQNITKKYYYLNTISGTVIDNLDIMNNKEIIKKLILNYENKKSNLEETIFEVNKISYKNVDTNDLVNYWKNTSLDEFIDQILVKPIEDWEKIDYEKSILLIRDILSNLTNDLIFDRNSEALEKRYSKPKGTLSDWIFIEDISDSFKILKKLKENNVIIM